MTVLTPPDISGTTDVAALVQRVAALTAELDEARIACTVRLDEEYFAPDSQIAKDIIAHRYVRQHRGWALNRIWGVLFPTGTRPHYHVPEDIISAVRTTLEQNRAQTLALGRFADTLRAEIERVSQQPARGEGERLLRAGTVHGLSQALGMLAAALERKDGA